MIHIGIAIRQIWTQKFGQASQLTQITDLKAALVTYILGDFVNNELKFVKCRQTSHIILRFYTILA